MPRRPSAPARIRHEVGPRRSPRRPRGAGRGHPSEPFVEATPVPPRIRVRTRTRSAAPSALNAASPGGGRCVPLPRRWSVAPAVRANDSSRMVDQLQRQRPRALGAERQVDHGVRTPADVDDGGRDGLVHRHGAVTEATDPARSPSASAKAAPRTSATSSTVWCSSTWRSPVARIRRSNSPWLRERAQQVIVEADPVSMSARPEPSRSKVERECPFRGVPGNADAAALAFLDGPACRAAWSCGGSIGMTGRVGEISVTAVMSRSFSSGLRTVTRRQCARWCPCRTSADEPTGHQREWRRPRTALR